MFNVDYRGIFEVYRVTFYLIFTYTVFLRIFFNHSCIVNHSLSIFSIPRQEFLIFNTVQICILLISVHMYLWLIACSDSSVLSHVTKKSILWWITLQVQNNYCLMFTRKWCVIFLYTHALLTCWKNVTSYVMLHAICEIYRWSWAQKLIWGLWPNKKKTLAFLK